MKPENWHRRHVVMLASQLPEETADALMVLDLVRELMVSFLAVEQQPEPAKSPVVKLVRPRPDLGA
jgi:hypothetical protein